AVEHAPSAGPGDHLRAAARRARHRRGPTARARRPLPHLAPRERARVRADREVRARGRAVTASRLVESLLDPARARFDQVLPSGRGFSRVVRRGQIFRIVDLEGNQAVDTLFYNAADPAERYSATDTIREQGSLYLTAGTRLLSSEGRALLTIV